MAEERRARLVSTGLDGIRIGTSECPYCARLRPGWVTCDAFPNGIPDKLLNGREKHGAPYEGDGGLLFKPRADTEPGDGAYNQP